jgi:hypothetical protein
VTNTVRRVSTDRRCGERIRDTNASFRMAFRSAEYVMAAACLHLAGSGAWGDDFMAGMGMTWFMTLSIMRSSSLSPFDTHCSIFVILMVSEVMEYRVVACAGTVMLLPRRGNNGCNSKIIVVDRRSSHSQMTRRMALTVFWSSRFGASRALKVSLIQGPDSMRRVWL